MAGNTVVLKTSEYSPKVHALIGTLFVEAGLPPGKQMIRSGLAPLIECHRCSDYPQHCSEGCARSSRSNHRARFRSQSQLYWLNGCWHKACTSQREVLEANHARAGRCCAHDCATWSRFGSDRQRCFVLRALSLWTDLHGVSTTIASVLLDLMPKIGLIWLLPTNPSSKACAHQRIAYFADNRSRPRSRSAEEAEGALSVA